MLNVLKNHSFKRLILLGDIFDDLNFSNLEKDHWELLSYIQEFSNPKRNVEIVWVLGNHDELIFKVISHFIGIKVFREYIWSYKNEKYLAIHGHQFDRFLVDNKFISDMASFIYRILQRFDLRLSRFIKKASKRWLRLSEKIAQNAARYALKKGVYYVFCGHTHQEAAEIIGGVNYFNVGCWTDIPSVFITVGEDGIKIHKNE